MYKPIVFFDSGVGGLPYLTHLRDLIPWGNYIYVADSKNFPYGEKDEKNLINLVIELVTKILFRFNPQLIVVACNTATVTTLDKIREITSVPIVGVVPAIKTASALTKNGKIGVLATKRTVLGNYLENLIKEFSSKDEVYLIGASRIVTFVENEFNFTSDLSKKEFIEKSVYAFKELGIDTLVLGCTHFIHVEKEILEAFDNRVKIVDSREGVSNQIIRILKLKKNCDDSGAGFFYLTRNSLKNENYKIFCEKSFLEFKGEL